MDITTAFPRVLNGVTDEVAPSPEGAEALFSAGPFADMVGAPPASQPTVDGLLPVARVDDLGTHRQVSAGSETVPSLVSGYLELPAQAARPQAVAIALNGVIGGVSEVYADGDRAHRFATLVSPRRFADGHNILELFLVVEGSDGPALQRVDVRAA